MKEITDEEKKLMILKDKVELVVSRAEKPSSFEFGRAGNRFKLYFDTPENLQIQINKLKELNLYEEEIK